MLIGILSEKKVSQQSERWHQQHHRPDQSNYHAPVPPFIHIRAMINNPMISNTPKKMSR